MTIRRRARGGLDLPRARRTCAALGRRRAAAAELRGTLQRALASRRCRTARSIQHAGSRSTITCTPNRRMFAESAERLVTELHRHRFLRRSDDTLLPAETGMAAWDKWNPAAGLFHTATRTRPFVDLEVFVSQLSRNRTSAQCRRRSRGTTAHLASSCPDRDCAADFRDGAPRAAHLATLRPACHRHGFAEYALHLSFGVQRWASTDGEGRVPLKTSPSGGARHPLEAYVLVRRVAGLDSGVYHYASDVHQLERLPAVSVTPAFDEVVAHAVVVSRGWVLVLLTAVFERTRWRYEGPRADRAVFDSRRGTSARRCASPPRGWGWRRSARWPSPTLPSRTARPGRSVRIGALRSGCREPAGPIPHAARPVLSLHTVH